MNTLRLPLNRLLLLPIGVIALALPAAVLAGGGEGGFDGVVHTLEHRYNAHATRIPFMGLVSLIARRASNGGVANLHVAEFDSFTRQVDGNELNQLVEQKLGSGWERMVRQTSSFGHDQTLVFTRPEGSRMGMFVVDLDGDEMDVVQLSVDPSHLDESMSKYTHRHQGNESDRNANKDSGLESQPN